MSQALKEWAIDTNPSLLDDNLSIDPEYQKWAESYERDTQEVVDDSDEAESTEEFFQ